MSSSEKTALVLLHGWGVNHRVWSVPVVANQTIRDHLSQRFDVHELDLPGYGRDSEYNGDYDLQSITQRILDRAPPRAIWIAWSLGATIAIQAALMEPRRFSALQLISPTPCFMQTKDWSEGSSPNSLWDLKQRFENGYQSGLKYFLMLQTSDRQMIRRTYDAICELPAPRREILGASLNLLTSTDLRAGLSPILTKVQIIVGALDRVVPPSASLELYKMLNSKNVVDGPGSVEMVELKGGHLCFLESAAEYFKVSDEIVRVVSES